MFDCRDRTTMHTFRPLIDDLLRPMMRAVESEFVRDPAADVIEHDGQITIMLDLPGVAREDIEIDVEAKTLIVAGTRKAEGQKDDRRYLAERPTGRFRRAFVLPWEIGADGVTATLADGVLRLTVAKPERAQRRRVDIG